MLPLNSKQRIRLLTAVARRGPTFAVVRVLVITLSLLILLAVPLMGLVRVDVWGGNHLLLGERVGIVAALRGFVIAMAILYGATFVSNMVVGRFFCGWGCPVGYVSRLGEDVRKQKRRRARLVQHLQGAGFVGTFIAAVMLWWVDPRVMIDGSLAAKAVTAGIFIALCAGGLMHASTWRFGFCRSACPIGLYYRFVTSQAPVGIVFEQSPTRCIECGACEKICPVAIDPKALGTPIENRSDDGSPAEEIYGDAECVRCGDCIEACRLTFAKEPEAVPPLRFGRPAGHERAGSDVRKTPPRVV